MRLKILALTTFFTLTSTSNTWAAVVNPTPSVNPTSGPSGSSAIQISLYNRGFLNLGPLIGIVLQLIMFLAGLLFLSYLLVGGLSWITAGGDPKNIAAARLRITNAFIGLVIVASTYAIILIVERVFGIRILSGFTVR